MGNSYGSGALALVGDLGGAQDLGEDVLGGLVSQLGLLTEHETVGDGGAEQTRDIVGKDVVAAAEECVGLGQVDEGHGGAGRCSQGQRGMLTGRLNARIRPVTTALKSPSVLWRFITFLETYSDRTAEITVVATTARALGPKRINDAISAGTRAIITSSIIPVVVSLVRRWGDALTTSFLPSTIIYCPPL